MPIDINQPELLQQLIEQAKLFREAFHKYQTLDYEYDKLKYPRTPSFDEFMKAGGSRVKKPKATKKQLEAALKLAMQPRQEIIDHTFRKILHKQLSYQQAFASFKKKMFNFYDGMSDIGINDPLYFDNCAASMLSSFQYVLILENACGAASVEIHQASLASLSRIVKILPVQEWVKKH